MCGGCGWKVGKTTPGTYQRRWRQQLARRGIDQPFDDALSSPRKTCNADEIDPRLGGVIPGGEGADRIVLDVTARPKQLPPVLVVRVDLHRRCRQ
jgi:hypothetical protein